MSGFEANWLALREPADGAARDAGLLDRARQLIGQDEGAKVVDLGCGTGSTLRAFGANRACWALVDHDPALLDIARDRLPAQIDASVHRADLRDLEALPLGGAQLVTASALFDLASRPWLQRFVAALRAHRAALYAALSYDGVMEWSEPHRADTLVVEAFNSHQTTDKGFGPALGPKAGETLAALLGEAGYRVETAQSPWKLAPGDLHAAFVEGVATAAWEKRPEEADAIEAWRLFRLAPERGGVCTVGHLDLLALD